MLTSDCMPTPQEIVTAMELADSNAFLESLIAPPRVLHPYLRLDIVPAGSTHAEIEWGDDVTTTVEINHMAYQVHDHLNVMTAQELANGGLRRDGITQSAKTTMSQQIWKKVLDDIFDIHPDSITYECNLHDEFPDLASAAAWRAVDPYHRLKTSFAAVTPLSAYMGSRLGTILPPKSANQYWLGVPTNEMKAPMFVIAHQPIKYESFIGPEIYRPFISCSLQYGVRYWPGVTMIKRMYVDI